MLEFNSTLVWTLINFLVLFLLLRHFLIKPVMNTMEQREKMIADGLQNARDTQEEALKMKQEYADALSGAQEESEKIVKQARDEAKNEYERILQDASVKAGAMVESAKDDIRREREQTMSALQTEIAGLAMTAAQKIMQENTDGQELYDRFLEETGGANEKTAKNH